MIPRLFKYPESQSFSLFGPRGGGKSTLLKDHFKNKSVTWVNLLEQRLESQLLTDPDALLTIWKKEKTDWVVIDEVQKIPALLDVVHRGIEDFNIKFALTGSSARKLKRGGANLLAGRAIEKRLYPFSSLELNEQLLISPFNLKEGLEFGLLPAIWSKGWSDEEKTNFLYSYVNTYLKEEIAAEQLVRKLEPFRRVLVAAAQSNTKIINRFSNRERFWSFKKAIRAPL